MHTESLRVTHIRQLLADRLKQQKFTSVNREASMTSLTGNTTIELVNASFIADEDSLFGEVNWDYVRREEEWYESMSRSVEDIPGGAPKIWSAVADKIGRINSNYGWCIYSEDNEDQFENVVKELVKNPESRRAVMIYTRPSMWTDYNYKGRSDFMCTNAVQYLIRDGALHAIVQMRSNDSIFGYRNDRAWQQHVLEKVALNVRAPAGNLFWNVGSLHVYARHYYLVDHYNKTGEIHITKEQYALRYPNSEYK